MNYIFAYFWAAPTSLIGLMIALPSLISGAKTQRISGVLEITGGFWLFTSKFYPSLLHFDAITFGHVIIAKDTKILSVWREHEHIHVQQYCRWGVLFLLAYPLASLWQFIHHRHPYWHNPFEVEAYTKAAPHAPTQYQNQHQKSAPKPK